MKRFLLLTTIICGLIITTAFAGDKDKNAGDDPLRKAEFFEPNPFLYNTSFPRVFSELSNSRYNAAISTGYYFVDSEDEAPDYWRPTPDILDTNDQVTLWTRIISGPRQIDPTFWDSPQNRNGYFFFRNPALPTGGRDFFEHGELYATDSTDDAIAGPIPIGFPFYFNSIRYDSFYVSTNGVIALTNRRYFYDADGNRTVPAGAQQAYDPMSADWFETGYSRYKQSLPSTGISDPAVDYYGYYYQVLGGNPSSATSGIRNRNTGTTLSALSHRAALIAPFWGDLHLSQWHEEGSARDDHGRAYFKRSVANDVLTIYIVNAAPIRGLATPMGTYTGPLNLRPGEQNYVSASAQVQLNYLDSSIVITYENFNGAASVGGRNVPAATIFRYNTTVGVRGFARHVNYPAGCGSEPFCGEYEQYTHYFAKFQNPNAIYPFPYLAIKFKQWKNTLRVVDIQYRVRKSDPNAGLDFTEEVQSSKVNNYELLAGEERIGAIQPVCILQNLTNDVQGSGGVNFQPQELNFRARFRIINLATERPIYNRLVPIDSLCLALPDSLSQDCTGDPYVRVRYSKVTKSGANYSGEPLEFPGTNRYNGIPSYGFVQIYFPPFEPNEFVANHIGRLKAFIIADPTQPSTGESLADQWPFDDTASVRVFVMNRLDEFKDDITHFHFVERVPMPSTLKWVNIDAEVADGDEVSHHPVAPRGEFSATNNPDFNFSTSIKDFTGIKRKSPVILMNRTTLANTEPATSPGGDELRSFPIDLRNRYGAVLSMSFQRTEKKDDWERGWNDGQLIGPEPRTMVNGDLLSIFGIRYGGGSYAYAYAASNKPDAIAVELMQPSPDGIQFLTNVENKRWRNHPRRGGEKPITNVPAYELYGSNGYFTAFLETDKDSSLAIEDWTGGYRNGLRPTLYDDGIDYEYKKAFIAIPDTFINSANEGAKNFRFRLKVYAYDHKKCITCIPDDKDPFYVDNIRMLFPSEITDVEVSSVKIVWPYTIAPASQATQVPIRVTVSNNTGLDAPTFWVEVNIFRGASNRSPEEAIYCRRQILPTLNGNHEEEVTMPSWNARLAGPGTYRLHASIIVPGGDLEPKNDTTWFDVNMNFGDVFAYDPPNNPTNDVPSFTGIFGRGLNLFGAASGGNGTIYGPSGGYGGDLIAGYTGGNGSGQIAVKFHLANADTVYGFQAYFGTLSQALDDITLSLYTDQQGNQPGQVIPGTFIYRQRGLDDVTGEPVFGEYMNYRLPSPVVLPAGTYWAVISQQGETGLELAASKSRMGMRTTNVYIPPPVTFTNAVGGSGIHLMIEKNFRKYASSGRNLINNNLFAFENSKGSNQWAQFMPSAGNPAYAHLHHFGISPQDNATATLSRGTWIPLLRPYLGPRKWNTNVAYDPCDVIPPVELANFDGFVRDNGIELTWETASEVNNKGFWIEKRTVYNNRPDVEWITAGFVEGAGNTNTLRSYSFTDTDVKLNTTYVYRLRQVDFDGTQDCASDEITLTFDVAGKLVVEPNVPNPFSNNTTIAFNLPENTNVKLEILDLFGNVVNVLVDSELSATRHEYNWSADDHTGAKVSDGTYIYRLTAGNKVATGKMTLVK